MKIKKIFTIIFFLFASIIYSQTDNRIYQVIIFKWSKIENADVKKVVLIDSTGNILLNGKSTNQNVNLKSFTKNINYVVKNESFEKIPGNDEPPRMAAIPKSNEQNVSFTVVFLNDFHKDKNLANKTKYVSRQIGLKLDESDYFFEKHFKKSDLETIKKLLQ